MGDDVVDRPKPPSAKAVTALLREARSLSRRADKLGGTAAAVGDPTTPHQVVQHPGQVHRPLDQVAADQVVTVGAACPVVNSRCTTSHTACTRGNSASGGTR